MADAAQPACVVRREPSSCLCLSSGKQARDPRRVTPPVSTVSGLGLRGVLSSLPPPG